ncbi:MAG: YybH family protein [Armatimonadota bacterium]
MNAWTPLLAGLALVLANTACQAPARAPAGLSDEDKAAIEGVIQEYVRTAMAGDPDAWAALWTEDAVKMTPNAPALEGRQAIRDWMAGMPALTHFTAPVVDVDGRGDLAYVRGTFTVTMTAAEMPEPVTEQGKYLSILRKQPDGAWLIAIDIWNSDLPIPAEGSEG